MLSRSQNFIPSCSQQHESDLTQMSVLGFEIPVFHGCIVCRGATSADLKVSADNYRFAYNPVCVCWRCQNPRESHWTHRKARTCLWKTIWVEQLGEKLARWSLSGLKTHQTNPKVPSDEANSKRTRCPCTVAVIMSWAGSRSPGSTGKELMAQVIGSQAPFWGVPALQEKLQRTGHRTAQDGHGPIGVNPDGAS